MNRTLTQKLGLLGIVSFLSYAAAVFLSPLAYPGYDGLTQAVSDLSAANAPSLALWNKLSSLYNVCEVVCATVVCIGIQGKKDKAFAIRHLYFCGYGMDICCGLSHVPVKRKRLRRHISG